MKWLLILFLLSGCSWFKDSSDYECETNTDFEKAYNQYDMCRRFEKVEFSNECLVDALKTHCDEI